MEWDARIVMSLVLKISLEICSQLEEYLWKGSRDVVAVSWLCLGYHSRIRGSVPPPNPREDPSLPHWPGVLVDQVPGSGFQRRKEGDCF